MRIVHLANHAQTIGNGTVNMMVDLACMQASMGQDVVVASSGGGFEPLLRRHGITHVPLQQSRQPWRVPSMIAGFNRLIDRFDPEIVHAHMMTGALISRFGSMRRRFALVTTVHHELQKSASLVRAGDRMVAVSRAVAMDLQARGIDPARMSIVLNGAVGAPRLVCRPAAKPVRLKHPNIVCVAGMYRRKGIADLLHAFALVREQSASEREFMSEPHLYLVGDGPERASMEALAAELGIAEVTHFTGFVADARPYLASADIFALAVARGSGAARDRGGARGGLRDRRDARGRHSRNARRRRRGPARDRGRHRTGGGEAALASARPAGTRPACGARAAKPAAAFGRKSLQRVHGGLSADA